MKIINRKKPMEYNFYYLSTSYISLIRYFGLGLITPYSYFKNRDSLQMADPAHSIDENSIVLSEKKLYVNQSECILEVLLFKHEVDKLENVKEYLLYKSVIPVSRVKEIFYSDKSSFLRCLDNAVEDTCLPDNHSLFPKHESVCVDVQKKKPSAEFKLNSEVKEFDAYLGGFALCTISDRYEKFDIDFFLFLSCLNNYIREEFKEALREASESKLQKFVASEKFDGYLKICNNLFPHENISEYKIPVAYLIQQLKSADLINHDLLNKIKRKLNSMVSGYPPAGVYKRSFIYANLLSTLDVLEKYVMYGANLSPENYIEQNVKSDNPKQYPNLFFVGFCLRYSQLKNHYHTSCVKMDFSNRIDYYLIESLYRYVFDKDLDIEEFTFFDKMDHLNQVSKTNDTVFTLLNFGVKRKSMSENWIEEKERKLNESSEIIKKALKGVKKENLEFIFTRIDLVHNYDKRKKIDNIITTLLTETATVPAREKVLKVIHSNEYASTFNKGKEKREPGHIIEFDKTPNDDQNRDKSNKIIKAEKEVELKKKEDSSIQAKKPSETNLVDLLDMLSMQLDDKGLMAMRSMLDESRNYLDMIKHLNMNENKMKKNYHEGSENIKKNINTILDALPSTTSVHLERADQQELLEKLQNIFK